MHFCWTEWNRDERETAFSLTQIKKTKQIKVCCETNTTIAFQQKAAWERERDEWQRDFAKLMFISTVAALIVYQTCVKLPLWSVFKCSKW